MTAQTFHSTIDASLLERCLGRNEMALSELFRCYEVAVHNLCWRMLACREKARDAMQDSFIAAFQSLASYRKAAPFGAWLRTIVVNRCLRELRSERESISLDDQHALRWVDEAFSDSSIAQLEAAADLQLALQSLPNKSRMVLWLYFVEGYRHDEIAQAFQQSLSFSKSTVARGVQSLRDRLGVDINVGVDIHSGVDVNEKMEPKHVH